jgi:uncharacterized protein (TIGR03437 family)
LGLDTKGCSLRIVQGLETKIPFHKIRTLFVPMLLLLAAWLAAAQVTSSGPADRVYRNGVIFTADDQHRTAEALAIRDGRIVYIGNNQGLGPFVGAATAAVDLKGRFLMPGLIDGHRHAPRRTSGDGRSYYWTSYQTSMKYFTVTGRKTLAPGACLLLLALLSNRVFGQPPAIDQEAVMNEASRMPPSLPGGALAPGTRIVIQGFRFGASPRVQMTSARQSAELRVLSSGPREIKAVLPNVFPSGSAELTVLNSDGSSRPFPILIVPGSLGIYTENGAGSGPAKIAAAHGNRITILGTGSNRARTVQIFVGGKRATLVSFHPDERETGIERLEFEIPANAPSGCHVPVLVRLPDGQVSNAVTVPVGGCVPSQQDPFADTPAHQAGALILLARLHVRSASIATERTEDFGAAIFAPVETVRNVLGIYRLLPPEGTCLTYTGRYSGDLISTLLPPMSGTLMQAGLEAGNELSVSGPNGATEIKEHKQRGTYGKVIGFSRFLAPSSRPLFLSPGDYTVSWLGGTEAPASAIQLSVPTPFSWTNASKIAVVNRNADLTLKWRPGGTPQRLAILALNVDPHTTALATCFCLAPRSSTAFSIPSIMLANLPKTPEKDRPAIPMSLLALIPLDELQHFRAPNLQIRALVTAAEARVVDFR